MIQHQNKNTQVNFKNMTKSQKVLIATTVSIIAVVTIFMTSGGIMPSDENKSYTSDKSVSAGIYSKDNPNPVHHESIAQVNVGTKELTLKKGQSADVSLTISYTADPAAKQNIVLKMEPIRQAVLTGNTKNMNPDDISRALDKGDQVPGLYSLSSFVSYSDPVVTLKNGETKTMTMKITIPADLPDELLNMPIGISPNVEPQPWHEDLSVPAGAVLIKVVN